jgi:hypothetical protein
MSATAIAAMFYGLGLLGVSVIILVTHLSNQTTIKALIATMQTLTEAIRELKGK